MRDRPKNHIDMFAGRDSTTGGRARKRRRWLGIQFECCDVYSRVYKNKAGTAYVGWCPRCGRLVRLRRDPEGTNSRFFRAR